MKDQIGNITQLKPQHGDVIRFIGENGEDHIGPIYNVDQNGRLIGRYSGFPLSSEYYNGGSRESVLFKVIYRAVKPVQKTYAKPEPSKLMLRLRKGVDFTIYGIFAGEADVDGADQLMKQAAKRIEDLEKTAARQKAKQKALHKEFGGVYEYMLNNC